MYEITKDIPLPLQAPKHSELRQTLEAMDVGDSITIKISAKLVNSVFAALRKGAKAKDAPKRFITREVGDKRRIWRER